MKEIINISLGSASENFDETIEVLGTKFRIKRLGVDFNIDLAKKLIDQYKDTVDLFTVSGFPSKVKINGREHIHYQLKEIIDHDDQVTILDGLALRDIYQPWFINRLTSQFPDYLNGKEIGFFAGCIQKNILPELEKHNCKLRFADPFFFYRIPTVLKSSKKLEKFLSYNVHILKRHCLKKLQKRDFSKPIYSNIPSFRDFLNCDIFVVNSSQLDYIKLPSLKGKTVILEHLTNENEEQLKEAGVEKIISITKGDLNLPSLNLTILEGILQLLKGDMTPLTPSEVIEFTQELNLAPQISDPNKKAEHNQNSIEKFSFIVHPLTIRDIFRVPVLRPLSNSKRVAQVAEKVLSYAPGIQHGKIFNIQSEATGKKIEGHIYTIFDTPKMIMKADKEHIYKKLIDLSYRAQENGSKIIGLGAYTKIVGDAGVTVSKASPIPVTTGNSLSAASTLWAASYAIQKMDFVTKENGVNQGTAMIVGATGSIGKVCSKLLSKFWSRVILVAPRPFKLIDLVEEVHKINPDCEILYTTDSNKYLPEADLVITTTSAQGKKILDIERVKPGAVICDVSRPFDINLEDSLKRPDVLVIASGEVELPGEVKLNCDIGLHGNTVYACLAETALLTLEGKFETFSLSRDINYKKVIEIDALARKHGVRLSAIMGHDTEITPEEIELCRQHALKKRERIDQDELRI